MNKHAIIASILFSFIFNKYNTDYQKYNSQGQEPDAQKPGHTLKKIAGESNSNDCLAQIPKIFGNEFLGFFGENKFHDNFLSLESVGESSLGNTTANVTDDGLNAMAFGENAFNVSIIASLSALSNL
jgi:hypothetical protein